MRKNQPETLVAQPIPAGIGMTPDIGKGNLTELQAAAATLESEGIQLDTSFPHGFWVSIGSLYHMRMTESTDRTMAYAKASGSERGSWKTMLLLRELRIAAQKAQKRFPDAAFILTPQNMLGEAAHSSSKIDIPVIMVLPDAMGKLHPKKRASKTQRELPYLVWNEAALVQMKDTLKIPNVQLIPMLDPLAGYETRSPDQLKKIHPEVFNEGNLCFIKLSGSGGDAKLINAAVTALWRNSETRSIIFPGQKSTQRKLVKKVERNKKVPSSLDEALFYNLSRNMIAGEQMFLTYPSEQFKHMMVLSQLGKRPSVVWLPPRGEHEVVNLAEYLWLASQQNLISTILLPSKHHTTLHKQLSNFGFSENMHYQFVTPEQLSKQHFHPSPLWRETQPRTPISQAILNILSEK